MSISRVKSPCIKCTERQLGCHSKCNKYKQFRIDLSVVRKNEYGGIDYRIKEVNDIKNSLAKRGVL